MALSEDERAYLEMLLQSDERDLLSTLQVPNREPLTDSDSGDSPRESRRQTRAAVLGVLEGEVEALRDRITRIDPLGTSEDRQA